MRTMIMRSLWLVLGFLTANLASAAEPVRLELAGPWQVRVSAGSAQAVLTVQTPPLVEVAAEKRVLALFQPKAPSWRRGTPLEGVRAQEVAQPDLLEPASLVLRVGPTPDAPLLVRGKDYEADTVWGVVGRVEGGRIPPQQPVYMSYRHALLRIDAVVLTADRKIVLRPGTPHAAVPRAAKVEPGQRHLANIWIPGRIERLTADNLFPILETAYPEAPQSKPAPAERLLPKTMKKLRDGQPLRILAWGDSVTVGTFVPDPDRNRWQAQFVDRLRQRYPKARIELVTEAWGGRNTSTYLAEPPGSEHNYQEKVLGVKPDLIVSEFVNDAGLKPEQVEERYGKLLADFQRIGAEWIILTPHYTRPDWMALQRQREVDDDPRPYVAGLRAFAPRHSLALADASLRWGRLWRQGLPYSTLLLNAVNHPDERGMKLFADSLLSLFPSP